jgi:hypothetical protein
MAAAVVADNLYVIGGFNARGDDVNSVFVLHNGAWSDGPPLPLALDHLSAAVAGGRLYVAGGSSASGASRRAFVLSAQGESWHEIAPMHHARIALALVALGDRLYAIGGRNGAREVGPIEVFDTAAGSWVDLSQFPHPRDHVAGFALEGMACAAGGRTPDTAAVDCYDPPSKSWRTLPGLPIAISGAGAASLGDVIVVAGGEAASERGAVTDQLAEWDGSRWLTERMLFPRHGVELAVLDGRAWACGGGIAPGLHPTTVCTSFG